MSLKSLPLPPVPEEIARVAHAVFPRGNAFIQVRDTLGTIYTDEVFADLFPTHGQPAFAPWRDESQLDRPFTNLSEPACCE